MFKYIRWFFSLVIPIIYHYVTWLFRWSNHPEKVPFEKRFAAAKKFAKRALKTFRVKVIVENLPEVREGDCYYLVGNHISLLDPVIMLAYAPCPVTFIAKEELRKAPIVGRLLRALDGVFIERDNLKQEIKALQKTRLSLENKDNNWVVFPEGTRNKDVFGPLLPYKAGTFKAPQQSGTTIIPFVSFGAQFVLPTRTRLKHYYLYLSYLDPFVAPPSLSTAEVAEQVEKASNEKLNALRTKYFNSVPLGRRNTKYMQYLKNKITTKESVNGGN